MLLQTARPAYVDQVISALDAATANDAELRNAGAGSLGTTPVVVLSTEQYLALYPGWRTAQDELAMLSTNTQHLIVGPGSQHFIAWQDPELVITAMSHVVDAARTGQALTTTHWLSAASLMLPRPPSRSNRSSSNAESASIHCSRPTACRAC